MRKLQTEYGEGYLTEEQWEKLLHRFGIKNVGETYQRACICSDYELCEQCPFSSAIGGIRERISCFDYFDYHGLSLSSLRLGCADISARDIIGLEQAKAIREHFRRLEKDEKGDARDEEIHSSSRSSA